MTIYSLAKEFGRTPASIKCQLQRMGLLDTYGKVFDHNRRVREPGKKQIVSRLSK
jgi:hypothetical protein